MSANTSIEWTDRSWNPTRGCSVISPGCVNCYAMKYAHRFSGEGKPYDGLTKQTKAGPQWTGKIRLVEEALTEPLSWWKPQRIFVNSMSDLFHESVPDAFIDRVFAVMALCPQHTFQVLTKRAERMRSYVQSRGGNVVGCFMESWNETQCDLLRRVVDTSIEKAFAQSAGIAPPGPTGVPWPLLNVWLGVSVERQQEADERIPLLLQTPAAVRFISAEPLLSAIDMYAFLAGAQRDECLRILGHGEPAAPGLDWMIVGGESGPGARPCDLAWVRSIVAQCKAAGTPVFVKQVGAKPVETFNDVERHDVMLRDRKGGDPSEWPVDLRDMRQFPEVRA